MDDNAVSITAAANPWVFAFQQGEVSTFISWNGTYRWLILTSSPFQQCFLQLWTNQNGCERSRVVELLHGLHQQPCRVLICEFVMFSFIFIHKTWFLTCFLSNPNCSNAKGLSTIDCQAGNVRVRWWDHHRWRAGVRRRRWWRCGFLCRRWRHY